MLGRLYFAPLYIHIMIGETNLHIYRWHGVLDILVEEWHRHLLLLVGLLKGLLVLIGLHLLLLVGLLKGLLQRLLLLVWPLVLHSKFWSKENWIYHWVVLVWLEWLTHLMGWLESLVWWCWCYLWGGHTHSLAHLSHVKCFHLFEKFFRIWHDWALKICFKNKFKYIYKLINGIL